MGQLGLARIGLVKSNGTTRAQRLADLYIKQHSDSSGKVTDPAVYQNAIDQYLAPYANELTVQGKIATYQNEIKTLQTKQEEDNNTLSDLQLREYNSMYITEDNGAASWRNPQYVANMSSEALDALVISTMEVIKEKDELGKDTSDMEKYLGKLMKKADRMRSFANSLESGSGESSGYGYFVDADPSTGKVRGAAIVPLDTDAKDITEGTTRTDTTVAAGNVKLPVYMPFLKDNYGQYTANFAGMKYKGDGNLMKGAQKMELNLGDANVIPTDGDDIQLGKLYSTFSGEKNIDGSPKKKYLYAGNDNKLYSVDPENPEDKKFLDSYQSVNGSRTLALNPYNAQSYATTPLPHDEKGISTVSEHLGNACKFEPIPEPEPTPTQKFFSERAKDFEFAKNTASAWKDSAARTAGDYVDKAKSFFKGKFGL